LLPDYRINIGLFFRGKLYIEVSFYGMDVDHKQRDAPDVVLQGTFTLSAQGNLLFQLADNFFKLGNKHNGLLNPDSYREKPDFFLIINKFCG